MKRNTIIAVLAILTLALGGCAAEQKENVTSVSPVETTAEETITTESEIVSEESEEQREAPEVTEEVIVTEEFVTEEITEAPETTTETPVQEAGLGKVTYSGVTPQVLKDHVDIYVTEAWYENGTFYTGCVVTNGFGVDKVITSIPEFIVSDKNGGEIAKGSFESVGLIVPAGGSVLHTFSFSEAAVKNSNADYSYIEWKTSVNHSDAYVTTLSTATQTIMGGKVKLTAEKKSDNTITLMIENNFDIEIKTSNYPQVRVNGIVQDLDVHTQLRNSVINLFNVPAGSKGVVTYYVNDIESVEALTGSMFIMDPGVTDKEFSLEF